MLTRGPGDSSESSAGRKGEIILLSTLTCFVTLNKLKAIHLSSVTNSLKGWPFAGFDPCVNYPPPTPKRINMAKLSTATFPPGVHERWLYDLEYGEQTADLQPRLFRRQLVRLSHPPAPPEELHPLKIVLHRSMGDF